jgi:hypothetical protein
MTGRFSNNNNNNNNNNQRGNNHQIYWNDKYNWSAFYNTENNGNNNNTSTKENRIVEVNHWETLNNNRGAWDGTRYIDIIHSKEDRYIGTRNIWQTTLER